MLDIVAHISEVLGRDELPEGEDRKIVGPVSTGGVYSDLATGTDIEATCVVEVAVAIHLDLQDLPELILLSCRRVLPFEYVGKISAEPHHGVIQPYEIELAVATIDEVQRLILASIAIDAAQPREAGDHRVGEILSNACFCGKPPT